MKFHNIGSFDNPEMDRTYYFSANEDYTHFSYSYMLSGSRRVNKTSADNLRIKFKWFQDAVHELVRKDKLKSEPSITPARWPVRIYEPCGL